MRYKVTQTETVEYVLEAPTEADAIDFIKTHTSRELRAVKPDIKTYYDDAIIEKTVMPADFHYNDEIEEIFDDWPGNGEPEDVEETVEENGHQDNVPDGIDPELPFN